MAEIYYQSTIMKNSFLFWKKCYKLKVKKLKNNETSKEFRKKHILKIYFNHWKIKYQNIHNKLIILEETLFKYQLNIKSEIFQYWMKKAKSIKWNRMYEDLKTNEVQKAMIKKKQMIIFKAWINYYQQKKRNNIIKTLATKYYSNKICTFTFNHWKMKYYNNKWIKTNDSIADNLYKKNLMKKYFIQWKNKKPDWHEVYNHYRIQPIIYWSLTLSKKVLEAWKEYSKRKKEMRKRIADAEKWKMNNDIKKGIITLVKIADDIYSNKLKEYEISVLPYQDFNSREYYLMRKYFTIWHMKALRNIVNNKKEEESIFNIEPTNNKYSSLFPSLLNIDNLKKKRLIPKQPRYYFDDTKNDFVEYTNDKDHTENHDKYDDTPIFSFKYQKEKDNVLNDILNNDIKNDSLNIPRFKDIKVEATDYFNAHSKNNQFNELLNNFK
eukprot:jgi/Orpsp1_1/1183649/evm.model.c7180000086144.1